MKKILIIPSSYPTPDNRIVGSFFKEQALFLKSKGIDIRILYINSSETNPADYFIQLISKKLLSFEKFDSSNAFLKGTLLKTPKLKSSSSQKRFINAYLKGFNKITSDNWKPDIIHAQCTHNSGIIAYFLNKKLGIPYYITEHNPIVFRKVKGLDKKAFENADKTSTVSYHLMRHILLQNINAKPSVLWNFIDENNFKINPTKSKTTFRVMTISYPELIKDLTTFFKAIEHLLNISNQSLEVVIIGNDTNGKLSTASTTKIEEIAKRYNVHQNCIFIPFVERSNIVEILNTADVFVSSSVSETFGVAIREAMMCGIPAIATKNGGVEDTIALEKANGILVNIMDYEAIATNILKIRNKEILFSSETIRNSVIEQSGRNAFYKNMIQFYYQ